MKTLFGSILVAVGILIAGAAGLCTYLIFWGGGTSSVTGRDLLQIAPWVLPPIAIGVGLIIVGVNLIREGRRG